MSAPLEVVERGHVLSFSIEDLMRFHGGGSPGGVAHAYKVLERALPLLSPDGVVERREIRFGPRSAGRARVTGSSA